MSKHIIRVIVPDFHGEHIDIPARDAFVRDVRALKPEQIIYLGDGLDCGGTFSTHQRSYTNELVESYEDDCKAANLFLDMVDSAAPDAEKDYMEGNHEGHVERWASRMFNSKKDADKLLGVYGPVAAMRLKERGIKYYKRSETYMGISIPGTIKKGKCYFTHGISHSKHCASVHLSRFGANVVFGHVHRSQSVIERTVTSSGFGAWCPGTLAKLQPLYKHTEPTSWSHGYGLQFVNMSQVGLFTGTFRFSGESQC
jgi:hypothetical protein